MARKLRVQYAGAIYHLMSRGDRREAVFKDDKDHEIFLTTLAQACEKNRRAGACQVFDGESFSPRGA